MIVVENLSKTFKKEEKEKGLRGSLKSLFSPNIKEVKAVDGINFSVKKDKYLVLSDRMELVNLQQSK